MNASGRGSVRRLADQRAGQCGRRFPEHGCLGIPAINTLLLLTSGVSRWSHWARRQTTRRIPSRGWPRPLHWARPSLVFRPMVHPCIPRAQPDTGFGDLWIDLLHAHRFPRHARDDRYDHADCHHIARSKGHFRPTTILRSKAWPGTGTSSTWSGWGCLSSSTCSDSGGPAGWPGRLNRDLGRATAQLCGAHCR